MMGQSTDRRAARPVRPAAAAVSTMMCRAWSVPPSEDFVAIHYNIRSSSALMVGRTAATAAVRA
jgi:hypothetical protein